MTNLLLRLFVKDYQNTDSASVRTAYGKLAGLVGILCNVLLCAAKLAIGLLSGSISILGDAVNNLSDAGSSVVTMIGFRLSAKPADEKHPFGHARVEYLSGLIVSALILIIGVELAKSSFSQILHPEPIDFSWAMAAVLLLSILVKLWMALFNRKLGRRIDSVALIATSADSRNDVITTAAVLICCLISRRFGLDIDGYVGLLVAVFIIWSGIGIARDAIDPLLGEAPDEQLVDVVCAEITSCPLVLGMHDLVVHDYGPGRRFATAHVEMDAGTDPLVCHDAIDNIERKVQQEYNVELTIHYDPLLTNDPLTNELRTRVEQTVHEIDSRLHIHDFRVVSGPEHTNLIFDLVVPGDLASSRDALKRRIDEAVQFGDRPYYTVITFDLDAFNRHST